MMVSRLKVFGLLVLHLVIVIGCSGGKMETKKMVFTSIKDVPESTWHRLSEKRIYFGHQSVGFNIIDGIQDVMKENPQIKLRIAETSEPSALGTPLFGHSKVGKNTDPKSKCEAFDHMMERGVGSRADIAFFKFCYVDVTAATDPDSLFADYKKTMSRLKEQHPKTTFVHVTVPLRSVQTGFKAHLKKIIGQSVDGYDDNVQRGRYNEMMRKEYLGKEPMFDLAGIECTLPDGTKATFEMGGATHFCMAPEYTDDGGHLNGKGRKFAAEQLLILLAGLSQ